MRSKEQEQAHRMGTKGDEMNAIPLKHMISLWIVYSYISFFHQYNQFLSGQTFQLSKFYWQYVKEVNGNTIVWRYIREQNRLMTLDPLGYDPIKDVDEIYSRHRRKTDDPYIKATMKGGGTDEFNA